MILTPNDTVSAIVATSQRRLNAILPEVNKEKKITLTLKPVNVNDHGGELIFTAKLEKVVEASPASAVEVKNSTPFLVPAAAEAKEPPTPIAGAANGSSFNEAKAPSPRNLEVKVDEPFVPTSLVREPPSPLKSLSNVSSSSSFKGRPPPNEVTGYHIVISEKGSEDFHCQVVGFNEQDEQLLCRLYSPSGVLDSEVEELPYSLPGVRWYKEKPSWAPGGHK